MEIKEPEPKTKSHVGIISIVEKITALVLSHLEIDQDHTQNVHLIPNIEIKNWK